MDEGIGRWEKQAQEISNPDVILAHKFVYYRYYIACY